MDSILQKLTPTALVTAIEANRIAFGSNLGRVLSVAQGHSAEADWFITGVPFMMANSVARTQFTGENVDAKIDETLSHFKTHRVPMTWWVGPMMRPTNLGTLLQARGLTGVEDTPGMAVDLKSLNEMPAPRGLTIERVADTAALSRWTAIASDVFQFPECMADLYFKAYARSSLEEHEPWYHYFGWLDDKPVAISSLLLAAGVAGIWAVATLPEARGQGIGTAITLAPLRDARAMGYHVGILNSSPMGLNVYQRLGFQEYCKVGFYVWAGDNKPGEE